MPLNNAMSIIISMVQPMLTGSIAIYTYPNYENAATLAV